MTLKYMHILCNVPALLQLLPGNEFLMSMIRQLKQHVAVISGLNNSTLACANRKAISS